MVSTKGFYIICSKFTRLNERRFVLDLKIEDITEVHGENRSEKTDPLVEEMQIRL